MQEEEFSPPAAFIGVTASPGGPKDGFYRVVSFLDPKEVLSTGGYPREAIIGIFKDPPGIDPINDPPLFESFRQNPAFIKFMHNVIAKHGPEDPGMLDSAPRQKDGMIYIISSRTSGGQDPYIPIEDIVGSFEVNDGQIIKDSYVANKKLLALSNQRFIYLPPSLHNLLIHELRKLIA